MPGFTWLIDPATGLPAGTSGAAPIGSVTLGGAAYTASGKTAVTGTFAATGQSATFTPNAGRGFVITLTGTFVATVQLQRYNVSLATWCPITVNGVTLETFTAPVCETWEDEVTGAQFRLNCTSYTSGTVNYEITQ